MIRIPGWPKVGDIVRVEMPFSRPYPFEIKKIDGDMLRLYAFIDGNKIWIDRKWAP